MPKVTMPLRRPILKFAMDEIVATFKKANAADEVDVIYGSSGKFHTQIQQGAPYDLNCSADIVSRVSWQDGFRCVRGQTLCLRPHRAVERGHGC